MIQIRREVDEIISGAQPRDNNVLKNAPHPISAIACSDSEWDRWITSVLSLHSPSLTQFLRPYSRQVAAYPLPYLHERKFWPAVSRIDDGELIYRLSTGSKTDYMRNLSSVWGYQSHGMRHISMLKNFLRLTTMSF